MLFVGNIFIYWIENNFNEKLNNGPTMWRCVGGGKLSFGPLFGAFEFVVFTPLSCSTTCCTTDSTDHARQFTIGYFLVPIASLHLGISCTRIRAGIWEEQRRITFRTKPTAIHQHHFAIVSHFYFSFCQHFFIFPYFEFLCKKYLNSLTYWSK